MAGSLAEYDVIGPSAVEERRDRVLAYGRP
jgi:hypothetical protein